MSMRVSTINFEIPSGLNAADDLDIPVPEGNLSTAVYDGRLVESLMDSVEAAEKGQAVPRPLPVSEAPEPNDFFYAVQKQVGLPCTNTDCPHPVAVMVKTKGEDIRPLCAGCAGVEWAIWMQGVR